MNVHPDILPGVETISASNLRPELAATIKRVEAGAVVVVTKLNLPKVVMVSMDYYKDAETFRVERERSAAFFTNRPMPDVGETAAGS